jgi:hypothetical protein
MSKQNRREDIASPVMKKLCAHSAGIPLRKMNIGIVDAFCRVVLVVGEPSFHVAMISWDKVRGRLNGDEADNIPFFYAGFAKRVREAEPGNHVPYV